VRGLARVDREAGELHWRQPLVDRLKMMSAIYALEQPQLARSRVEDLIALWRKLQLGEGELRSLGKQCPCAALVLRTIEPADLWSLVARREEIIRVGHGRERADVEPVGNARVKGERLERFALQTGAGPVFAPVVAAKTPREKLAATTVFGSKGSMAIISPRYRVSPLPIKSACSVSRRQVWPPSQDPWMKPKLFPPRASPEQRKRTLDRADSARNSPPNDWMRRSSRGSSRGSSARRPR